MMFILLQIRSTVEQHTQKAFGTNTGQIQAKSQTSKKNPSAVLAGPIPWTRETQVIHMEEVPTFYIIDLILSNQDTRKDPSSPVVTRRSVLVIFYQYLPFFLLSMEATLPCI